MRGEHKRKREAREKKREKKYANEIKSESGVNYTVQRLHVLFKYTKYCS